MLRAMWTAGVHREGLTERKSIEDQSCDFFARIRLLFAFVLTIF